MKKKILNIILIGLCFCFILLFVLAFFLKPNNVKAYDFNSYDYQSANLIDGTFYNSTRTANGITSLFNSDSSVMLVGAFSSETLFSYCDNIILEPGTYTLSGSTPTCTLRLTGLSSGVILSATYPKTFTIDQRVAFNLYIEVTGSFDSGVVLKPIINKGSSALPFIPNIRFIFNSGYDESLLNYAEYNLGPLLDSTFNITYSYSDNSSFSSEGLSPDFFYNGFNFNSWVRTHEVNSNDSTLSNATVTINFAEPFNLNTFPILFSGESLVQDFTFTDINNNSWVADRIESNYGGYDYLSPVNSSTIPVSGLIVKSLKVYFGRASDLLYNANFIIISNGYLNGYNDGYNTGLSDSNDIYYDGFNDGYDSGYNSGFTDGVNNNTFSFGSFLSGVLDVLDVDIFGVFSLGDIFAVVLGASIVILVLKIFVGG